MYVFISTLGPKKAKIRHAANRNADGTTEVIFTPTEVGLYLVSIEQNNRPIPGNYLLIVINGL